SRHVNHLNNKFVSGIIRRLIHITEHQRKLVYVVAVVILGIGIYGITLMKSSGYMVDDIPEDDPVYKDLKFFESNFDGLMPLEIMVDTKSPGGVMQLATFSKIDQLEKILAEYSELSPP